MASHARQVRSRWPIAVAAAVVVAVTATIAAYAATGSTTAACSADGYDGTTLTLHCTVPQVTRTATVVRTVTAPASSAVPTSSSTSGASSAASATRTSGTSAARSSSSAASSSVTGTSAARTSTSATSRSSSASSAELPAQVLNLSNWKLTLPANDAQEIEQPQLATFADEYFETVGDAVQFTAPVGGATTSGSGYPRSELREMTNGDEASWSTTSGTNVLTVTGSTTALPPVKPQVVIGQIHDSSDDVLEVLADGLAVKGKVVIGVRWNGAEASTYLDSAYTLGTPYTYTVTATGGVVTVRYQSAGKDVTMSKSITSSGDYFKAGAYTQSNPSKGDSASAIGRTTISAIAVSHTS